MNQITFTKITSDHDPLTKTMSLNDDGKIVKKSSAQLHHGRYEKVALDDLPEFARYLEMATAHDAFCYGTTTNERGQLVKETDLALNPGAIARTRAHFGFVNGPGIMMLDNDNGQIFNDSLVECLWENVGFLDGVSMLSRASSSSNLYNLETDECLRTMLNQRAYLIVSNASFIPAIGKLIETQLWDSGNGYFDISTAGTLLRRCTVDTTVWQPERLDFVGGAVCVRPLEQRHMNCELKEGYQSILDVRYLPKINPRQLERIRKNEKQAKAEVEVDRLRIRAAWVDNRTSELINKGVKPDEARHSIEQAAEIKILGGGFVIIMETGDELQVAELLANPEKYHGHRCRDPLEPEYHGDHRIAYISLLNGGKPYIFSHAHGGTRYVLKGRPKTIQIHVGESARCTDEISKYLADQGVIYERGQALLEVNLEGHTRVLNTASVKYLAGSACNLMRFDQRTNKLKPTDLTDTVAQLIVGRGGKGVFPKLTGVVTAPTITSSGRIISSPGYDTETGLLFLNNQEGPLPEIIKRPDTAALKNAYAEIFYPFKDFPFDGDVSRSCLIAAIFTAVVRPGLPTAPGFGFDAPTAGSGKTKIAKCVAAVATGRVESLFPPPTDDEETRKKIATALAKNRSVLIFDNIEIQLKSPVLAAFLTSESWSDRLLGGNTEIESDTRMLVIFTGNNLAPVGDIVRRILVSRIDTKLEASDVWKREFKLDPLDYVLRNRQRIVAAVLTLLSGYIAAGRPKMVAGKLASFEEWDGLVRQPIVWLSNQGIPGLCDPTLSLSEAAANDPDAMRMSDLAQQWYDIYGSIPQPLTLVMQSRDLGTALKEVATDRQGYPNAKVLASYLRRRVGKIINGYRFERHNGRSNTSLWQVVRLDAAVGGFGGLEGSVSCQPPRDIKIIINKSSQLAEIDPPKPPNPPPRPTQQSLIKLGGSARC